ncbi:MAG: transglutaminase-like domain-containing protein, partial [Victivallales bacterium]|nr:transglutaminase-like domain-containing protein [Victivallales bacterium]MCF7888673.1 transglutaminase-like domain-containing protein [Victivallales bacterium]
MENLKSPLNILILIGLICQGMTWDTYYLLFVYCLLWLLLCSLNLNRKFFGDLSEFFLILTFLIFFYLFIGDNLFEKCMGLGNALAVLQLLRMTYRLDYRRKIFTLAIALTQIAIGAQVFLNYMFAAVLILTIILVPKILFQINYREASVDNINPIKFKFLKHKIEYLIIFSSAILFFLLFPRINFESNTRFYSNFGNIQKKPVYFTKPELKTSNESASEEDSKNNVILFQVYADSLMYFKSFSMDKFDGDLWSISYYGYLCVDKYTKNENLMDYIYRKVNVRYSNFNSKFLPVDGKVEYIEGNFFDNPFLTRIGNIIIHENVPRKNKNYEYWIRRKKNIPALSDRTFKRLTKTGGISEKLKKWLLNLTKNTKDKYEKAQAVCSYLNSNFKYELGAPKLKEKNPVENFIFKEKRGHCGRFASALAVLLRALDIPAKVAVGYMAKEKNNFGNYYNIRIKDSHAWTEAYFRDRGWINMDATPADEAALDFQKIKEPLYKRLYDYIEYIWYSKIVNLTYGDQLIFIKDIGRLIKMAGIFINRIFLYILLILGILSFSGLVFFGIKKNKFTLHWRKRKKQNIKHFYDRLLRILEKYSIKKPDNLTPYEFLDYLYKNNVNNYDDINFITDIFCRIKYGMKRINENEMDRIENIIESIGKFYSANGAISDEKSNKKFE